VKNETSQYFTRIRAFTAPTQAHLEEVRRLAEITAKEIGFPDSPQSGGSGTSEPVEFFRPVKETITVRLDSDILHWLKKDGKGYQSRLNLMLRKEMVAQLKRHQEG